MSQRVSMRKIREILRLKWQLNRSNREIAISVKISSSTVSECVRRARNAKLSWPLDDSLDDQALERLLYKVPENRVDTSSLKINWVDVHHQMKRKGVTLQLLWHEYKAQYPAGISYTRYCHYYREWREKIDVCMRQDYKAGEKLFVDYAGLTVPIIVNRETGETKEAQIFVGALGASNYLFVEATLSQSLFDWIGSHVRMFEFLGGVPEIIVPDNLKSGVKKSSYYEPDLNPTYLEMANHYNIAVIPARVQAPRDKAKVEQAVQHVERQILAPLRDRIFFSITELNQAIKPLLNAINSAPFQKLPGSRRSEFETQEKALLQPLPQNRYQFALWKKAKLGIDYHIEVDKHYYSAPYQLAKKSCDVRYTRETIEIYYRGKRIASHRRSYQKGKHTTVKEHMPERHRKYAEWSPERIVRWAKKSGEATASLSSLIMASRKHPQQGYRSCMGLIRLGKKYGPERLDAACGRALAIGAYAYKSVESILKNNLDGKPIPGSTQIESTPITAMRHDYLRGGDYFE